MTLPAWHLASTPRPASSLRVGPKTSTLGPDGSTLRDERGVTIEIPASVRAEIARLCAASPAIETGGGLLSEGLSLGTTITIARAGAPGRSFKRRRDAITFDPRELDDDRLVGLWHSHPHGGDRLSPADLDSFRRMRRGGRRPISRFVALIATPDSRRGWKEPGLAAWIIGDDYHRRARLSLTAERGRATGTIDANAMYTPTVSFATIVDDEQVTLEAGRDYIVGSHELVRRHPERFRLAQPHRRRSAGRRRRYAGEIR